MKILKTDKKSVSSINRENTINIQFNNSYKNMNYTNVVDKVNAMTVFENERLSCNKYRLFFNIKPYCTNVLFNPFTEIVEYKDKNTINIIYDDSDAIDLTNERVKLIQNTSNKTNKNWEYYPGYDMFNNHLIRSNTFKIVQNKKKNDVVYNTIEDKMYDNKGKIINFYQRLWSAARESFTTEKIERHLYKNEDILSFGDGSAINERLIEEDGWFGFENSCRIKTRIDGVDQEINKVIQSKNGGDFIDMYPDRTLFSFNPKLNKHLHRLEYNWHYVLTYPFACDKQHNFCKCVIDEEEKTGLKLLYLIKTKNAYGSDVFLFRTFTKHGLKEGDNIQLSMSSDDGDTYNVVSVDIAVANLGDIKGDDTDYCFLSYNMNLLTELYYDPEIDEDDEINEDLKDYTFMINRVYGGVPSEYYFRLFKKIPNLKFKKEFLTTEIASDLKKFEEYNNENDTTVGFAFENSKMGFASSIFNDNTTQLIFVDDVDITNITDNLGRPLTEFYLTIIKNNKGNDLWYDKDSWPLNKNNIEDIEFSHCFGKLTCGLDFGKSDNKYAEVKRQNGDIRLINNLNVYGDSGEIDDNIKESGFEKSIISTNNNFHYVAKSSDENKVSINNLFYGDFVEYNPNEAIEKVLSKCKYRFNTVQREHTDEKFLFKNFVGSDIVRDDYDISEDNTQLFQVTHTDYAENIYSIGNTELLCTQKPEGYYYDPHYKIQIKELGALKQDSHYDIIVREAKPVQFNGIYISITSNLKHGCVVGDRIFICDDVNDKWYYTNVVYVVDKLTFYINHHLDELYGTEKISLNWINTASLINSGDYKVRRENTMIPRYAQLVNKNQFIWREILHQGDKMTENLQEYPYMNNAFYINQDVNFYLNRQDPHGEHGLFTGDNVDSFPQDIKGNSLEPSNYEYKDETKIQC